MSHNFLLPIKRKFHLLWRSVSRSGAFAFMHDEIIMFREEVQRVCCVGAGGERGNIEMSKERVIKHFVT